jgi:peptide deformylase
MLQAAGEDLRPDDLDRVTSVGEAPGHRVQPPLHVEVDTGEGQAPLLAVLLLLVGELKDRVDEVSALAADRIGEHPQADADLRCGEPVTDFDKQLRSLVKDLTQTLDDAQGAGLAAPQIGVGLRVFAYAVGSERGYLVNPVLEFPDEEEQYGEEGCLSFPGIYYDVKRRLNTVARGFTDRGDPIQVVGTEVLARCLQHETDHLDGVLFIDRMDVATRKLAMREIRAANWDGPVKITPHRMTDRIF